MESKRQLIISIAGIMILVAGISIAIWIWRKKDDAPTSDISSRSSNREEGKTSDEAKTVQESGKELSSIQATPTVEESTKVQETPTGQEAPTGQATPTVEESTKVQGTPTGQEAPTGQATPTVEESTKVQGTPTVKVSPTGQATPTVEESTKVQGTPTVKVSPTGQATPTVEESTKVQGTPTGQEALTGQEAPTGQATPTVEESTILPETPTVQVPSTVKVSPTEKASKGEGKLSFYYTEAEKLVEPLRKESAAAQQEYLRHLKHSNEVYKSTKALKKVLEKKLYRAKFLNKENHSGVPKGKDLENSVEGITDKIKSAEIDLKLCEAMFKKTLRESKKEAQRKRSLLQEAENLLKAVERAPDKMKKSKYESIKDFITESKKHSE